MFDVALYYNKYLTFYMFSCRLEVPTMSGKFKLPIGYSQEMECRVLELPFSQRRMSMFILLPDDSNKGLQDIEKNMSTKNITKLFSTLKVSYFKYQVKNIKILI